VKCDNCGMQHRAGENKLCNGPFIFQVTHQQIVREIGAPFFWLRNQFNHRMIALGAKKTEEDQKVIDEGESTLRRNGY
jgi:hypothetical protein